MTGLAGRFGSGWWLGAALLALLPAPAAGQGGTGASAPVALVISNSNYAALPRLPTCEMSANLVASTLSRAGFKVSRQTNPSNARLGTAIATLGDDMAAAPDSRALIYLCGYVAAYADRVFLVPVEARLDRDADLLSQGIVARLLMGSVAGPTSRAGLVLVDAATLPDQKARPDFSTLLRPGDAASSGLAVAALPAGEGQGPAPLATALADMLTDNRLEVGAELAALSARPGMGRSLTFARAPTNPAWLLGAPDPAPVSAPAPAAAPPVAGTAAPVPSAPVPSALADPNPAERRRVQLGLQRLGYFRGRINGVFGPDTLAAVRQFQKDSGNEATGRLTAAEAEVLLRP